MSVLTEAAGGPFDADSMWVPLADGRFSGVPPAWFPRLLNATPARREQFRIRRGGLHRGPLDEDIFMDGLLRDLGG